MLSAETTVKVSVTKHWFDITHELLLTWAINLDNVSDEAHTPILFRTLISNADLPWPSIMSLTRMCRG